MSFGSVIEHHHKQMSVESCCYCCLSIISRGWMLLNCTPSSHSFYELMCQTSSYRSQYKLSSLPNLFPSSYKYGNVCIYMHIRLASAL